MRLIQPILFSQHSIRLCGRYVGISFLRLLMCTTIPCVGVVFVRTRALISIPLRYMGTVGVNSIRRGHQGRRRCLYSDLRNSGFPISRVRYRIPDWPLSISKAYEQPSSGDSRNSTGTSCGIAVCSLNEVYLGCSVRFDVACERCALAAGSGRSAKQLIGSGRCAEFKKYSWRVA